jgi:hypothetical protein
MTYMYTFAKLQTNIYSGSYIFRTADGRTIVPTAESIASVQTNQRIELDKYEGHVMLARFQWDVTKVNIPSDATTIEGVTLVALVSDLSDGKKVEIVTARGASNDSITNTPTENLQPIITMNQAISGSTPSDAPYFFDTNTLLLPVNYYINSSYIANGKRHTFALMYYMDDQTADGVPTLELYHNRQGDVPTIGASTSYSIVNDAYNAYSYDVSLYCQTYDITQVLQVYRNSVGALKDPVEIRIKVKESKESINIDDAVYVKDNTYTVTYEPVSADNK